MMRFAYIAALAASTQVAALQAQAFELSLPIACDPETECLVQNLVDTDPGPGRADAFCGNATYDGHRGTDFRIADIAAMKRGVDVLAAAPGTVTDLRDGEPDGLKTDAQMASDRECGNGVVIRHGDGWVTQYCHLARDSIKVARGTKVTRGQPIGRVGLSGNTQFPHVHMSLRRGLEKGGDATIDPATGRAVSFTPASAGSVEPDNVRQCASSGSDASLWDETARGVLRGKVSAIVASGFAGGKVPNEAVVRSEVVPPGPSGALVLYAQFMNVRRGDVIELKIDDAQGRAITDQRRPVVKNQATYTAFAGKSRMQPGSYGGQATLIRDNRVIASQRSEWTRE